MKKKQMGSEERATQKLNDTELRLIVHLRLLQQSWGKLLGIDLTFRTRPNLNPAHLLGDIHEAVTNQNCFLCGASLHPECPFLCSLHHSPVVTQLYKSLNGQGSFFDPQRVNKNDEEAPKQEEEMTESSYLPLEKKQKFAYMTLEQLQSSKLYARRAHIIVNC